MRTAVIKEFAIPRGVEVRETPAPGPPKAHQVKVQVRATSLNYRDLWIARGDYGSVCTLPFVPLSDAAGEIIEVGSGVERWKVGDRVIACFLPTWTGGHLRPEDAEQSLGRENTGVLREQLLLSADAVVEAPRHLSYEEASTLPCTALTAWNALFEQGRLMPGQTVLLQGTGSVSLFALQFARMAGAHLIVTTSGEEKESRLREMGANQTINYVTQPEWGEQVRELTGGRGADVVVEVGGAGTLAQSLKAVATGGMIASIGVLAGGKSEADLLEVVRRQIRLQGIIVGSREMFERMNRAIAHAALRPVIDQVFPLERAGQAYAAMAKDQRFGKIVISLQEQSGQNALTGVLPIPS